VKVYQHLESALGPNCGRQWKRHGGRDDSDSQVDSQVDGLVDDTWKIHGHTFSVHVVSRSILDATVFDRHLHGKIA